MAKEKRYKKSPRPKGATRGTFHPCGFWYQEERRPVQATRIGQILPEIIARYGLARQLGNEQLDKAWQKICQTVLAPLFMGQDPDSLIRPTAFRRGTITLQLVSNILLQEFSFYKEAVLAEFRRQLPLEKIVAIKTIIKASF